MDSFNSIILDDNSLENTTIAAIGGLLCHAALLRGLRSLTAVAFIQVKDDDRLGGSPFQERFQVGQNKSQDQHKNSQELSCFTNDVRRKFAVCPV